MVFTGNLMALTISLVPKARIRRGWVLRHGLSLLLAAGSFLGAATTQAQDATWSPTATGNWNTASNWVPPTVPTGTASFGPSSTTTITFSAGASVGTIELNAGAPAYSFNISPVPVTLTITGLGIVNNSSNLFNITITDSQLKLTGSSTAGTTFITNDTGGVLTFGNLGTDTSTAGRATITNNGGSSTFFNSMTTAGNATITNNADGVTAFSNNSTAGNATITNNNGGTTFFLIASTGGQARFITNAGGAVDISGLTSTGMTAGSIEGAGTYFLGSKALTVGGNNLSTEVSGIIEDGGGSGGTGGALIKAGTGTLTLSGTNTYTGGTTILAGTLQLGAGGTTGMIAGNVIDNGTLTFNRSDNLTFAGTISGAGSLEKLGAGTLTLTGNNIYNGATNVAVGTLQAGATTSFSPNSAFTVTSVLDLHGSNSTLGSLAGTGIVINNGPLPAILRVGNNNSNTTFTGQLLDGSGTLGLTKIGTGTLILTGNSTYLGGTTISNGALQLGNGGASGSISGNVTDNGSFIFERSDSRTFGGVISGTGSVSQNGLGTTILSGNNSYTGGTIINAGTLLVNGAKALGLGDVLVNRGTLGADPQPINVNGNYTQSAGGTLQLRLGGSGPGQLDFLNVGGRASLDGTLQLLSVNGFQPKIGEQLTLVHAAGGVTGQFDNVLDPFSPLFVLDLIYQPNSVVLGFASNFAAFAQTPNQQAVAAQLDKVASDPREAQLISFLLSEPTANIGADFEKISPDSLSAIYEISFSAASLQAANLENRFAEIRNGSTGFTSSLSLSNPPGGMVESKEGKAVIEPGKNVLTPSPENKWGVWISGSGDFVNVSGDGNGKGYDFATGGVSLGLDYRLTKNLTLGVAAGYAHTWTNLTGNGNIDVDSGRGGLYATFSQSGFYLGAYAGGAHNSYETMRAALGGGASGSTSGGEFDGYVSSGYDFHYGGFTFGPIASLAYSYVNISEFNERGSLAPLRIVSQSEDSLRTNLGLSASYTWRAGKVQLTPSSRVSWQHEYLYSALPIDAQFASGAGNTFTVNGPAEGHDSALIDAGLDIQWTPTIGTYFGYNGQVGADHYDSQGVICSVHINF
jgi:autotransporter-associated beta strand protein